MASGLVETVELKLSVHLIKSEVTALDGAVFYTAFIHNIAAGSGATPEEAYRSLAICLAVGDPDVPSKERIEPWDFYVQAAVDAKHQAQKP